MWNLGSCPKNTTGTGGVALKLLGFYPTFFQKLLNFHMFSVSPKFRCLEFQWKINLRVGGFWRHGTITHTKVEHKTLHLYRRRQQMEVGFHLSDSYYAGQMPTFFWRPLNKHDQPSRQISPSFPTKTLPITFHLPAAWLTNPPHPAGVLPPTHPTMGRMTSKIPT